MMKPLNTSVALVLGLGAVLAVSIVGPGHAQTKPGLIDIQIAVGMPGSLGIAGLDAMTKFCTGQRNPHYRSEIVTLAKGNLAHKRADRLVNFYDKRFDEWSIIFQKEEETAVKATTCSAENIQEKTNPEGPMWARKAAAVGFPGF